MINKLSSNLHGVCLVKMYSLPFRGSIRSFELISNSIKGSPEGLEEAFVAHF